jgi:hypothetical protein
MNSNHIGLLIGVIILIAMMVMCHYARSTKSTFQNITANKIQYYATPNCKNQTLACPGQHPMIPCKLIKKCPGTKGYENLSDEDKRIVDMYIYLSSLLESVDVYNFPNDDYWYKF